jgi:hypothetical protein
MAQEKDLIYKGKPVNVVLGNNKWVNNGDGSRKSGL